VPLGRVLLHAAHVTIRPRCYGALQFAGAYVYNRSALSPLRTQHIIQRNCLQATRPMGR
jgi:hypothetical protein